MGILDDVDRRREREQQTRENSARMAQAYAVFHTEGQGTHQYEERVNFGLTFTEKPVVAYGSACDIDDLAELLDIEDSDDTPLPVTAGFVTQWDQDERDFYTGCWVAVRVNFPTIDAVDPEALPYVEHHFTWSAIAMKDVPPDLSDATV